MDDEVTATSRTQKIDNDRQIGQKPAPAAANPELSQWVMHRRRSPVLLSQRAPALRVGSRGTEKRSGRAAPLTVGWIKSTLTRLQRAYDRTAVLPSDAALGRSQRMQHFAQAMAATVSQVSLIAFRREGKAEGIDRPRSGYPWETVEMALPTASASPSFRPSEGEFVAGSRIPTIQGPSIFSMPGQHTPTPAPVQRRPTSAARHRPEQPKVAPKSRLFTHVEEVRQANPAQETPQTAVVSQADGRSRSAAGNRSADLPFPATGAGTGVDTATITRHKRCRTHDKRPLTEKDPEAPFLHHWRTWSTRQARSVQRMPEAGRPAPPPGLSPPQSFCVAFPGNPDAAASSAFS